MAQRSQTRAGDVTGREREKQQQEHAKEIKAGAERISTTNPPPRSEPDGTVVDLTGDTDGAVRMLTLDEVIAEGLTEIPDVQSEQDIDVDMLDDGRTIPGMEKPQPTRPEEPQPTPVAQEGSVRPGTPRGGVVREAQTVEAKVAERPFKVLRVNEDLEEVTIGKGNTFTFVTGQYYKVTPEVYDHLDEKGFVYH